MNHFEPCFAVSVGPVVSVHTQNILNRLFGSPPSSELLLAAFYANLGHFSINLMVHSEVLNIDLAFHKVIYPQFI